MVCAHWELTLMIDNLGESPYLITIVVNMMYLQIIYQHEALEMPKQ